MCVDIVLSKKFFEPTGCYIVKTMEFSSANFLMFIKAYRILPKAVLILTPVFSAISLKDISA